jgi:hypothetical protein
MFFPQKFQRQIVSKQGISHCEFSEFVIGANLNTPPACFHFSPYFPRIQLTYRVGSKIQLTLQFYILCSVFSAVYFLLYESHELSNLS